MLHSLPIFVRLQGRPVILLGEGDPAAAKRRLLERAGAVPVGEESAAALAIVAVEDDAVAHAAIARLKARGILVNAVDRAELCDFTLPAIIDRDPVLIAIGTGGASAGLAKALRQRLEAIVPMSLGRTARALADARALLKARFPGAADRRRAIDAALGEGGPLDVLGDGGTVADWLDRPSSAEQPRIVTIDLVSRDPDDLTLRQARLLGGADRLCYASDVPTAILDRARADAVRDMSPAPSVPHPGLTLILKMAT